MPHCRAIGHTYAIRPSAPAALETLEGAQIILMVVSSALVPGGESSSESPYKGFVLQDARVWRWKNLWPGPTEATNDSSRQTDRGPTAAHVTMIDWVMGYAYSGAIVAEPSRRVQKLLVVLCSDRLILVPMRKMLIVRGIILTWCPTVTGERPDG